ncbi:predicted protein [Uncinocarpus reesii 1704]|uniref:Uncharacterized protein n=1 Tax=Uncinocarpus reesii (strain UAMH 1704) TaxID=336963 RepID=C4JI93_UNCRE|nr:uncharacterized protein UREG_02839 [Uncinocarpus reesii 1704]EEP77990.1 predicted protein [Uncinocarpus reesii 1704]
MAFQDGNKYQGIQSKRMRMRNKKKVGRLLLYCDYLQSNVSKQKKAQRETDLPLNHSQNAPGWEKGNHFKANEGKSGLYFQGSHETGIENTDSCYWNSGIVGYNIHDGVGDACAFPDTSWCTASQEHYAYYPIDPWYGYWPYGPYASMTHDYEFNAAATAPESFQLRAEAPEFIPTGQSFSSNDGETEGPVRSDSVPMTEEMAEARIHKRYVTI